KAVGGIAPETELATRPPRLHRFGERRHVAAADMALVGARVHGDAQRAGGVRDARELDQVGHPGAPRIAQQGDLVEVYAEPRHCSTPLPQRSYNRPSVVDLKFA